MLKYVFVFGNGKVDRSAISDSLADRLQVFVDTQRKSATGNPCVISMTNINPLVADLYEQTAEIIENFESHEDVMRHSKGAWLS